MPDFEQNKAYTQKEEVFFDDGREIEILHYIYDKPDIEDIRGSPARVLAAIDEFARTKKYLMNVGEDKGKIVTELIAEVKPETMASTAHACLHAIPDLISFTGGTRWLRRLLVHLVRRCRA